MALTNAFQEAVVEKNVQKIRIMLKDSLLVDPSFERFNEMERAASSVDNLYVEHDGRELSEDHNVWDDAYMDKLMVQVVGNFSHERVEHLKKVVRYLRPVSESKSDERQCESREKGAFSTETKSMGRQTEYQKQKYTDQMSGNYRGVKVAGGAILGGIVGAGVGTFFSASGMAMFGVVAVGVVAGGATAVVFTERK